MFNLPMQQDGSGYLNIFHAKDADEGKYECFAKNRWGVAYSYAATLYVKGMHLIFFKNCI